MRFNSFRDRDDMISGWLFAPVTAGLRRRLAAFAFLDMLMSIVVVALVFGLVIKGYVIGAERAEWTNFSLAGQQVGQVALERARSAVWDLAMQKNELLNMTQAVNVVSYSYNSGTGVESLVTTNLMNVPWKGNNYMLATNYITIQILGEVCQGVTNNLVQVQVMRVDTVWPFYGWGKKVKFYTNSICTYVAPDNRDPSTLGLQ